GNPPSPSSSGARSAWTRRLRMRTATTPGAAPRRQRQPRSSIGAADPTSSWPSWPPPAPRYLGPTPAGPALDIGGYREQAEIETLATGQCGHVRGETQCRLLEQ